MFMYIYIYVYERVYVYIYIYVHMYTFMYYMQDALLVTDLHTWTWLASLREMWEQNNFRSCFLLGLGRYICSSTIGVGMGICKRLVDLNVINY